MAQKSTAWCVIRIKNDGSFVRPDTESSCGVVVSEDPFNWYSKDIAELIKTPSTWETEIFEMSTRGQQGCWAVDTELVQGYCSFDTEVQGVTMIADVMANGEDADVE